MKTSEEQLSSYLKSDEFKNDFHERVKKDTWGNGLPMIYMDENGDIISHWQDGVKDILLKDHPLIDKRFHLGLSGSAPVHIQVVFVSKNLDITVKYLPSTPNRFERFNISDFKTLSGWKETNS